MCSVQGVGLIGSRGGLIGSRGGTIGRTGDCLGPFMRRLTPQVVVQAGRPHCHLSVPAAQERVTTTSKRAHRPTRAQSGARAQNHGVNVQTLPTRRREQMHHLLYRLSRTRKPKSRATSNTQCPITRI